MFKVTQNGNARLVHLGFVMDSVALRRLPLKPICHETHLRPPEIKQNDGTLYYVILRTLDL
jgi:hypothetical protein